MGLLNKAGKRAEALRNRLTETVGRQLPDGLKDRLNATPLRSEEDTVTLQGSMPNPLGSGELVNLSLAVTTIEDAGGERTRIRARVSAPVLQRLAPSYAARLNYEAPNGKVPALIKQLPGGDRVVRGWGVVKSELGSRLPVVEPTGDEVTTVFDIDMNRRKPVLAEGESRGLVARAKEQFALMAGPESWHVDQQEQVTDEGFRGLVTIRSGDDSPVEVLAKVGVELKKKDA